MTIQYVTYNVMLLSFTWINLKLEEKGVAMQSLYLQMALSCMHKHKHMNGMIVGTAKGVDNQESMLMTHDQVGSFDKLKEKLWTAN